MTKNVSVRMDLFGDTRNAILWIGDRCEHLIDNLDRRECSLAGLGVIGSNRRNWFSAVSNPVSDGGEYWLILHD